MRTLTRSEFEAACKTPYWRSSMNVRWPYMDHAARVARSTRATTVLELGANGVPIVHGSDTMDIVEHTRPKFLWNATKIPWPIPRGAYDLFIALQVFEHLGKSQKQAFAEVMRVARKAILSFPYMWPPGSAADHVGITKDTIQAWTLGVKPAHVRIIGALPRRRIVYYWDFTRKNNDKHATPAAGAVRAGVPGPRVDNVGPPRP